MTISKAMFQQLNEITNIYKQTINRTFMPKYYIRKCLDSMDVFTLRMNGTISGVYITYTDNRTNPYNNKRTPKKVAWLEQIMVLPDWQGNGFGKMMMEHYLHQPADEYRLVCHEHNILFYERFGFKVEESFQHKGTKQFLMCKCI